MTPYNRNVPVESKSLLGRLEDKILIADDCWLWTGACDRKGYGALRWQGKVLRAHRVVYELLVGPVARGMQLDQLCRVHACVKPQHLEQVDNSENQLRHQAYRRAQRVA